jgi:hypothetical protein
MCGLSEPPQVMTEGEACLAFFLLLELDIGAPAASSMATKGKLEYTYGCYSSSVGKIMSWGLSTRKG